MKRENKSPFPGFVVGLALLALLACGTGWFLNCMADEVHTCFTALAQLCH